MPTQLITVTKYAVAYVRRSTDRQEQSIADQRAAIEAYAAQRGFEVLRYYVDDAISGSTAEERAAFMEMINASQQDGCPFRYILVYDVKRFGRLDTDEAGHYRHLLKQHGVRVIYISDGFTGAETDELLLPVKQWLSRQELRDLSKVTIRGQLSRVQAGWWGGGLPPYGYDRAYYAPDGHFLLTVRHMPDGSKDILDAERRVMRTLAKGEALEMGSADRSKLIPSDPERIQTIRDIFNWYVEEGLGFISIANRLNTQRAPTARGGSWSRYHGNGWGRASVRDILLNPVYTGDMVWNRLTFAKFFRIQEGEATARDYVPGRGPEQNHESDWLIIPDTHPPLIDRELFARARERRNTRRAQLGESHWRSGRGANSPFLISGMIQCARCGHYWHGTSHKKGRPRKDGSAVKTYYYICGGHSYQGNATCQRQVIPQEAIEDWVLTQIDAIATRLLAPDGCAHLSALVQAACAQDDAAYTVTLHDLQTRREEINRALTAALIHLSADNQDFVNARLRELRQELVVLEREEARYTAMLHRERQIEALITGTLEHCRRARSLIHAGAVHERRTMIRTFLHQIEWNPVTQHGTAIFWQVPREHPVDPRRGAAGRCRRSDLQRLAEPTASTDSLQPLEMTAMISIPFTLS